MMFENGDDSSSLSVSDKTINTRTQCLPDLTALNEHFESTSAYFAEFQNVLCFGLQIYIQRVQGCDHMRCGRCSTNFCYSCGRRRLQLHLFDLPLEDHDFKFSILGCNEKFKPNQQVRRVLVRGGVFGEVSS